MKQKYPFLWFNPDFIDSNKRTRRKVLEVLAINKLHGL
jgi:hypothetical protein